MNFFDLIILAVLVLLTLRGGMKGMVSQIVSVASYFVCWIVASRFSFAVAPSIPAQEPWNRIGAMLLLFVGTMIAIRFLHRRLEKRIESWQMKEFDRQMGALLGFAKGVLVCMVITFFAVMLTENTRQSVFASKSGKYLARLITKTGAFIPGDTCKLLKAQIDLFDAEVSGSTTQTASATSALGLFARGNALVDETQKLRDELNEKSNNAASLLDAVAKWWSGDAQTAPPEPSATKAEPEVEPEKQPEPPILAKQQNFLQPPPTTESAKLALPVPNVEPIPVMPKPSVQTSEEQLLRNMVSSPPPPVAEGVLSSVPISPPKERFIRRLATERPLERLLSAVKEEPSSNAAMLFSPHQRQTPTTWDPKTWAQSLESTQTR